MLTPRPKSSPDSAEAELFPPAWIQREAELLAAVRQRDAYIAVVAHDMKNYLSVIRGMAQILVRQAEPPSALAPAQLSTGLTMIQGSTRKLNRLVDEFLDNNRLQSGAAVEIDRRPTNLVALVRACVQETVFTTGRDVAFAVAIESIVGQWDATRLERVVVNLLSNAVKYSAAPSVIRVTLHLDRSDGSEVAIVAVEDTGAGIPQADLSQIFTPYFRASNVAPTTSGFGIGLFGARAIVEQHGGSLRLTSTVWVGTTATVRLPLAPILTQSPSEPPPKANAAPVLAPQ